MSIQSITSGNLGFVTNNEPTPRPVRPVGSEGAAADNTAVAADVLPQSQTVAATNEAQNSQGANQKAQRDAVENAAKAVEKFVSLANNDLRFSVDKDTDKLVVRVVDKNTNEVIRQFPSDELLQLSRSLDKLQGLLVKQTA